MIRLVVPSPETSWNRAVTVRSALMVIVVGLVVPVALPDHPTNLYPVAGVAVSWTEALGA